ncbi:MAG: GNAT family N-acetyltransferase [Defluviitaleaceae bacterium]|nr:GNAT family N-acetyltransferase [Defluviitaleaceae bacterium]
MKIRKSILADLEQIEAIYEGARAFMRDSGNPSQWKNNHPPQEIVEADIKNGDSYVCVSDDGEILAVFFFTTKPDPTYTEINGAWLNNKPYGVIHRIARKSTPAAKGAGRFCIEWCFRQIQNLRIDTHEDNAPMLVMLNRLGFVRCGIIKLENGEDRVALQKIF